LNLECEAEVKNPNSSIMTNKLHGLNPSMMAIVNVKMGRGRVGPIFFSASNDIYFIPTKTTANNNKMVTIVNHNCFLGFILISLAENIFVDFFAFDANIRFAVGY